MTINPKDRELAAKVASDIQLFHDGLKANYGEEWCNEHVCILVGASTVAATDEGKAKDVGMAAGVVGANNHIETLVSTVALRLGNAYERELGLDEGEGAIMFLARVMEKVESSTNAKDILNKYGANGYKKLDN